MPTTNNRMIILLADDDPEEEMLVRAALEDVGNPGELRNVRDGEELLQYLSREGDYANPDAAPRPNLILLDLNMPRMDGHEALQEIKQDASLKRIPVVVLTTSKAEDDLACSFLSGASAYVNKPVTGEKLARILKAVEKYQTQTAAGPAEGG